jgi:hypothetical protein
MENRPAVATNLSPTQLTHEGNAESVFDGKENSQHTRRTKQQRPQQPKLQQQCPQLEQLGFDKKKSPSSYHNKSTSQQ